MNPISYNTDEKMTHKERKEKSKPPKNILFMNLPIASGRATSDRILHGKNGKIPQSALTKNHVMLSSFSFADKSYRPEKRSG